MKAHATLFYDNLCLITDFESVILGQPLFITDFESVILWTTIVYYSILRQPLFITDFESIINGQPLFITEFESVILLTTI
jgi:hypothetical protein